MIFDPDKRGNRPFGFWPKTFLVFLSSIVLYGHHRLDCETAMEQSTPINEDRFRQVWDGDSETDCVEVCHDLQKAGIEYRTTQQPVSRTSRMGVEWKFKVYVLNSDYQSAKRVLGVGEQTEGMGLLLLCRDRTLPRRRIPDCDRAAGRVPTALSGACALFP